jgi:hypothetical protein
MYDVGTHISLTHLNEQPSQSFSELASANIETEYEVGTFVKFLPLVFSA